MRSLVVSAASLVLAACAVGLVAYIGAATVFRVSELTEITAAVRARLPGADLRRLPAAVAWLPVTLPRPLSCARASRHRLPRELFLRAILEDLIGQHTHEHDRAHHGEIERAVDAQQVYEVLQNL